MIHEDLKRLKVAIGAECPNWSPAVLSDVSDIMLNRVKGCSINDLAADLYGNMKPEEWQKLENDVKAWRRLYPKSGNVKRRAAMKPITAADLKKKEIPPIQWLVDELLPIGLSMLAAPPKYYKSYMALDLGVAIATGGDFLGFRAHKHKALYLDLESTERRPKSRLLQILGEDKPFPENLLIVTAEQLDAVGRIGDGFEEQVAELLDADGDIKLIIVDVFQRIRPPDTGKKGMYDRDYDDYEVLKRLADDRGIGLLLIHHMRKQSDSDEFNQISGSSGTLGSLDTAWAITKKNGDRSTDEATLSITGRDVVPQKYRIRWNKNRCVWELMGTEEQVADMEAWKAYDASPIVRTVRALLHQNGGEWQGTASDIQFASHYLNGGEDQIFDDVRVIGRYLREHMQDFRRHDEIRIKDCREGQNRKRMFSMSFLSATSATSEPSQMSLLSLPSGTAGE